MRKSEESLLAKHFHLSFNSEAYHSVDVGHSLRDDSVSLRWALALTSNWTKGLGDFHTELR